MIERQITIRGKQVIDKHTHYEVPISEPYATVIIRGDVATDFMKKYGLSITEAPSFEVTLYLTRNDQNLGSDPFKSPGQLRGSVASLDDIVFNP